LNDFQKIFEFVREIPSGNVMSYGGVGRAVGVAARTVGFAMASCPEDVPWHRVVGSDGYLRIVKRSPIDFAEQKARLADEGVAVDDRGFVASEFFVEGE
jgi:alkylated DNA nucleotide flippase Atl1